MPVVIRHRWRMLRWMLVLCIFLWIVQAGLDWMVHRPNVSRRLTARLNAAFGRPVEVGQYDVTLWSGPRLLAQSVVVAEDPRFGKEYFLRADTLAVRVRWLPLLRGRIALGTLSFDHPSLNLAINPSGRVNLADWLPRSAGSANTYRGAPSFSRVKLNLGRINFKSGDLKLPFALTLVNGFIEQQAGGRWRISLDAQPMRAAVLLQRVGTLHLEGTVGGTTSRLRPADLQVSWQEGSVADLLRFWRGDDMGARGDFSLALAAHASGEQWNLTGQGQARRLHRWDLPLRSDNPSVNMTANGAWLPGTGQLHLSSVQIEAPHSNGQLSGSFGWQPRAQTAMAFPNMGDITLSAAIGAPDVLAFLRAFRAGIAEQLAARGEADVNLSAAGWPPRLASAQISTHGATLEGGSLTAPLTLQPASMTLAAGRWSLPESQVVFEPDAGVVSLLIRDSKKKGGQPTLEIHGQVDDMRQVSAVATALGYTLRGGWDMSGSVVGAGEWDFNSERLSSHPSGKILFDGVVVRAPFLARPIGPIAAQLDFSSQGDLLHIQHAEAFGSSWTGELTHDFGAEAWHGNLSAGAVDVGRINDFLNPEKRQSMLNRIFPFLASTGASVAVPENLRWSGRLEVNDFQFGQMHLSHLRASARLDRRVVELQNAGAELGRGQVAGTFTAHLNSQPDYHADVHLHGVELGALEVASLGQYLAGVATGKITLSATGRSARELISSLQCEGDVAVSGLALNFMDLDKSYDDGNVHGGESHFPLARGNFRCGAQRINFTDIRLSSGNLEIAGQGIAGFDQSLNFRLAESRLMGPDVRVIKRPQPFGELQGELQGEIDLTGTLGSPKLSRVHSSPPR